MTQSICLACMKSIRTPSFISSSLCSDCCKNIPWITEICCETCGRPTFCPDCPRRQTVHTNLIMNRAAVSYNHTMKQWLAGYKFRGDERWSNLMTEMMQLIFRKFYYDKIDLLSYVPISESRAMERTFNQTERIATNLSSKLGIPVLPLLKRLDQANKQSLKNRHERLATNSQIFQLNQAYEKTITNVSSTRMQPLRVLLIDDVYTTGSTLHKCANILATAVHPVQSLEIFGMTWAR